MDTTETNEAILENMQEATRYVKGNIFDMTSEIIGAACFSASLAVSEIADTIYDWWQSHEPWWWPI